MRVASSTLSGSGNDELTVIRGVLGSDKEEHIFDSLIKKIKPLPVEFRRPSIFVLQVIHLNMLVMVLVTIQLVYHRFK